MSNKCCTPYHIKVPRYNDGALSTTETQWIEVPCGRCLYCLKNNQREWILRLLCEAEVRGLGYFVTLTYNDEHLEELNKKAIQRFLHTLRVKLSRKLGDNAPHISYLAVGEYGRKTNRQHYHLMLFGLNDFKTSEVLMLVESCWNRGFCYVKPANLKNMAYITKYLTKLDPRTHDVPPFSFRLVGLASDCYTLLMQLLIGSIQQVLGLSYRSALAFIINYLDCGKVNFSLKAKEKSYRSSMITLLDQVLSRRLEISL